MEWFAIIIPVIAAIVMLLLAFKKVTWWEVCIPAVASILFIIIFKFSAKTVAVHDNEYWGSQVVEARYYEYWDTWVSQTCTSTCCCDSKGNNCTTTYYDCSYCSTHSAYWMAYDDAGNSWEISKEYYAYLQNKWKSTPEFVDQDRDIVKHGSCGTDGDMYRIRWNIYNNPAATSESAVTEHSYTNRVQASHSAFSLPYIKQKDAEKMGLYEYPLFYNNYKQKVILGLDSIYQSSDVKIFENYFQYLNGYYGKLSKVKLFICLFYNKPKEIAFNQEAYWSGGNQNEIVICIGIDRASKNIEWVKPFSWTDNKRVLVDLREDISNTKVFSPMNIYPIVVKSIADKRIYKDLNKDFSYLEVELTFWQIFWIYFITLAITVGTSWWAVTNDIDRDGRVYKNDYQRWKY